MTYTDCIINVGHGAWYPKGSERLRRSLIYHGFAGEIRIWNDTLPPNSPTHKESSYAFKIHAFKWAIERGYQNILWLDCSAWCVKYPEEHFKALNADGYYLLDSGWQVDQWTNDHALDYFKVSRKQAQAMPMISSGVLGLNTGSKVAMEFFRQWEASMQAGAFIGPWFIDPEEAADERHRGHRHDQSCASIIAHQLGMKLQPKETLDMYYRPDMPETVEFALQGM